MDGGLDVLFMPCRHLVVCRSCSPRVRNCPVCRALITTKIEVYTA